MIVIITEWALQISFLQPQMLRYLLGLNYSIFFDTFQDACLILLGFEMMCGWDKILNSGGKFCRPQDIQPTQASQNITVCLGTVPYARCHILEYSEMNCMSSIKYNIWLWKV